MAISLRVIIVFATLSHASQSMLNSQPPFAIKAEKNKAADKSCLFATFNTKSGNIADCLARCLENCRCQSFQICQNTKCQLCSSHKEENSSLLHDEDDCIYATYEMRHQKLDGQCSDMSCAMKYNCCQQSDFCPKNKTCKPTSSYQKPWKRFTCECPDGYSGDNCNQPITSCQGYAQNSRISGMYKVLDLRNGTLYEVYCQFDSHGAWTLVLSYSIANGSFYSTFKQFRKELSKNLPVSENALIWSGYRLSKSRMKSIQDNSTFLMFTCDYEKYHRINESDYLQILLANTTRSKKHDVLDLDWGLSYVVVGKGYGKISEYDLRDCEIVFYPKKILHVRIFPYLSSCMFNKSSCFEHHYFRSYRVAACLKKMHRCAQNDNSTTQIWFGVGKADVLQQPPSWKH